MSNMNMNILINEINKKSQTKNSFLLDKNDVKRFVLPSFTKKIFKLIEKH